MTFLLRDEGGDAGQRMARVVDDCEEGHADVIFIVGGNKYGSIRGVLAVQSPVLSNMLLGEFREARVKEIPLEQFDNCAPVFRAFLIYLHTREAHVDTLMQVSELLDVSKYFEVPDLVQKCRDGITTMNVEPSNAVEMLNICTKHQMKDELRRAWEVMGIHADRCLQDFKKSVELLPDHLMKHLFMSGVSSVSEITLVRLLMEMSEEKREELKNYVRLPLISASDMLHVVRTSGLFTDSQCLEAACYRMDPTCIKAPMPNYGHKRSFEPEVPFMDWKNSDEVGRYWWPPYTMGKDAKGKICSMMKGKGKAGNAARVALAGNLGGSGDWTSELPMPIFNGGAQAALRTPSAALAPAVEIATNGHQQHWFGVLESGEPSVSCTCTERRDPLPYRPETAM
mmetsp:Transcript_29823/g.55843  ORF Transcript_29823/g.55843 Transcript_29823/m.55843 type:complete len:397 (-) Transcript_29823:20-1210(-)